MKLTINQLIYIEERLDDIECEIDSSNDELYEELEDECFRCKNALYDNDSTQLNDDDRENAKYSIAPIWDKYTAEEVADKIDVKLEHWPGNCHAIATKMLDCLNIKGRVAHGGWDGQPRIGSIFYRRPLINHSWIVVGKKIIDPTRWEFEQVQPYIYYGDDIFSEYDEGRNRYKEKHLPKCPDPSGQITTVKFPKKISKLINDLAGRDLCLSSGVPISVLIWIASLPDTLLGEYVVDVYKIIARSGHKTLIPIDNYRKHFGSYHTNNTEG